MDKKKGRLHLSYYNVIATIHEEFENPKVYSVATSIPPGCEKYITEHLNCLAPDSDFKDYKNGDLSYEDFKISYVKKIKADKESLKVLRRVKREIDEGYDVFLICYEKDYQVCHRYILARLLLGEDYNQTCDIYPVDTEISEYIDVKNFYNLIGIIDKYMNKYPDNFNDFDKDSLQKIKDNLDNDNLRNYFKIQGNLNNSHVIFNQLADFIGTNFLNRQWVIAMKETCTALVEKERKEIGDMSSGLTNGLFSKANIDFTLEKLKKKADKKRKPKKVGKDYIDNPVKFKKDIMKANLSEEELEVIKKASEEYATEYDMDKAIFLKRLGIKFKGELLSKEQVKVYPVLCPMPQDIILVLMTTSDKEWLHEVYKGRLCKISDYWGKVTLMAIPSSKEEETELIRLGLIGDIEKEEK